MGMQIFLHPRTLLFKSKFNKKRIQHSRRVGKGANPLVFLHNIAECVYNLLFLYIFSHFEGEEGGG